MKYFIKICLFFLSFSVFQSHSQDKNEYFRLQDSTNNIPNLAVRANVGLIALSLYSSAWTLGYTGHRYFVNEKAYLNAKRLKPYFLQLNDEIATNNFKMFENSKKTATICGGVGFGLYFVGFVKLIAQLSTLGFPTNQNQNNREIAGFLIAGSGLMISAPIIKLRGISKLKIAIKRHNSFR
jgi:hypothetical protein